MLKTYFALVHRSDKRHYYGVFFPDFPGCVSAGPTKKQALEGAYEALKFHIEGMKAIHERIPLPSTLDQIMKDPENRVAKPFKISVKITDGFSTGSSIHHHRYV